MLIILTVVSQDMIMVGWIKKIIVRDNKAYFICIPRTCVRQRLQYFRCVDGPSELRMVEHSELKSYKPLLPRGTECSFVFFLYGKVVDDPD